MMKKASIEFMKAHTDGVTHLVLEETGIEAFDFCVVANFSSADHSSTAPATALHGR